MNVNKKNRGGTLVEVIVATLITGILLVPVLNMLGYAATSYHRQSIQDRGVLFASQLMAEIQSKSFEDESGGNPLGPDAGESDRLDFDDVDDFHELVEAPPQHRDGTDIAGADGFRRVSKVTYLSPTDADPPGLARTTAVTNYKLIQVKVFFGDTLIHTSRSIATLSGLSASRWSGGEQVKRVTTSIQLGADQDEVASSMNLLNSIPEEVRGE